MVERSSRDGDIPSSGLSLLPLRPSDISPATVSQGDLSGSALHAEATDNLRDSPLIVAAPTHGTTTSTNHHEGPRGTEQLASSSAISLWSLLTPQSQVALRAALLLSVGFRRRTEVRAVPLPTAAFHPSFVQWGLLQRSLHWPNCLQSNPRAILGLPPKGARHLKPHAIPLPTRVEHAPTPANKW